MKPTESVEKLAEFAKLSGVMMLNCTLRSGFEQFFSFHEKVKADGCEDPESDMLLFQWGICDWGQGKFFEVNMTRQFIETGLEDNEAISQLSLTFKYEPTVALETIGAGNTWSDGPLASNTFPEHVFLSPAFLAAHDLNAKHIELAHLYV